MKLSIDQTILSKGLAIVGRSVATRSALPILSSVLLTAGGNSLWMTATNLERVVICELQAKVDEGGAVAIPWKLFAAVVAAMPPTDVRLELDDKTQTVRVTCGGAKSTIRGESADGFPKTQAPDGSHRLRCAPELLRQTVRQVAFAASGEKTPSRPALGGVRVMAADGGLLFVATDGYRMSESWADVALSDMQPDAIIPVEGIEEAGKLCAESDAAALVGMEFDPGRNRVAFIYGGAPGSGVVEVALLCQLIDAKFPDFKAIIPKTHTTRTEVNTADLRAALRVAALFAHGNNDRVMLQMTPGDAPHNGTLSIRAESAGVGDHRGELTVMVTGQPIEMAINVASLLEALGAMSADTVALQTTMGDRPIVLASADIDPTKFQHVIMPMDIRRGA
jgi:DNA polymerase-3 subunit beta